MKKKTLRKQLKKTQRLLNEAKKEAQSEHLGTKLTQIFATEEVQRHADYVNWLLTSELAPMIGVGPGHHVYCFPDGFVWDYEVVVPTLEAADS